MKTKTLEQFIREENEEMAESLMGLDVEELTATALKDKNTKLDFYNKMVARFEKLQQIGKISNLVKNEDLSISWD